MFVVLYEFYDDDEQNHEEYAIGPFYSSEETQTYIDKRRKELHYEQNVDLTIIKVFTPNKK